MKSNILDLYRSPSLLANMPSNTPVLLALSGGADSTALLHILCEDAKKAGFPVFAAHFHHGIRGEEADRDALFCQSLAQKLGVPFFLGKADVPTLAKQNGNSIEAEAREQRYAFFKEIMQKHSIPILITAHHAEDQIESILLHILRGSGITGLCGMSECRSLSEGLYLVRPILRAEKQSVLDYCKENGIDFVTDSTNSDTEYQRNHLRANVTPKLREVQPKLEDAFYKLSQSANEANDLINSLALSFINENAKKIEIGKFNPLHKAVKARVLSIIFEDASGATLERVHVESLIKLCENAVPHSSISLPGKFSAYIENECLVFEEDAEKERSEPFEIPFKKGEFSVNGVRISVEENPESNEKPQRPYVDIRCDILFDDACFRSRKEGDSILVCGMHKKVKKLLNEKRIPLELREKLPILTSNKEILWIPTVAACDGIKSGKIKDGENFFRITVNFENN